MSKQKPPNLILSKLWNQTPIVPPPIENQKLFDDDLEESDESPEHIPFKESLNMWQTPFTINAQLTNTWKGILKNSLPTSKI